jgi:hypothetical protein
VPSQLISGTVDFTQPVFMLIIVSLIIKQIFVVIITFFLYRNHYEVIENKSILKSNVRVFIMLVNLMGRMGVEVSRSLSI